MTKDGLASDSVSVMVLAGGKGTRMNSEIPKVLHTLNGKALLGYVLDTAFSLNPLEVVVIVGHKASEVRDFVLREYHKLHRKLRFVLQENQLGTGHAVMCAVPNLSVASRNVLILYGDVQLVTKSTLSSLIKSHLQSSASLTVLTTFLDDPSGYGRIVRDSDGNILKIVEDKEASSEEKSIKEVNTGIIVVDSGELKKHIYRIEPQNSQNEYYLTDIIEILSKNGDVVKAFVTENSTEVMGVNTKEQLSRLEDYLKSH